MWNGPHVFRRLLDVFRVPYILNRGGLPLHLNVCLLLYTSMACLLVDLLGSGGSAKKAEGAGRENECESVDQYMYR